MTCYNFKEAVGYAPDHCLPSSDSDTPRPVRGTAHPPTASAAASNRVRGEPPSLTCSPRLWTTGCGRMKESSVKA
ncbi:hypothetical protein PsYK624_022870 [Phanerochaete sordida]|uniref:Uncharacterized protein n=1 Tax=Phanerochaete sordida TaxID=48140 RepID=A0A9P3G170_9APHY|nr:hypothetical protein PsYK624_022870 [Phanerochaete sordida]